MKKSKIFRSREFRLRVWKTLNVVVAITTVFNLSVIGALVPSMAGAEPSSNRLIVDDPTTPPINAAPDTTLSQPTGSVTVNTWLWNGLTWTLDNTAANTLGTHWILDGSHVYSIGQTADTVTYGSHTIAESEVFGYHAAGYFIDGSGKSCAQPAGTTNHFTLSVGLTTPYVVNFCNALDPPRTGTVTVNTWFWNGLTWTLDNTTGVNLGYHWILDAAHGYRIGDTVDGLALGPHTIAENGANGYHAVGYFMTGSGQSCSQPAGTDNHFTLHIGTNLPYVVNFCNARDSGTVTLHNVVDNDKGLGSAQPGDWTFTVNGQAYHDGDHITLPTGVYPIVESGPSGYTVSDVNGGTLRSCHTNGGTFLNVTPQGGDCTLTHTYMNVFVPTAANLSFSIGQISHHTTAVPGQTLIYQVTLANSGDLAASDVQVDTTLPSFIGPASGISDAGVVSGGHILWNGLTIPGHDSKVLTYTVTVNSSLSNGTTILHTESKLGCSSTTPCPFTGTATDETIVTLISTIRIDNQGPGQVKAGDAITYTLHWFVEGAGTVTNAVVSDVLPSTVTFVSADLGGTQVNGTVTWNLGQKKPVILGC